MAFDNTKYDIELNGVPHRILGYKKSEGNAFVPRIGGGDQTESEFDLLRSKTINGFEGGALQKNLVDPTSMYAIEGEFPFKDDGVLYGLDSFVPKSGRTLNLAMTFRARVTAGSRTWICFYNGATSKNVIYRLDNSSDPDNAPTAITMPAKLEAYSIVSMVIHNGEVWVSGTDGTVGNDSMWYMGVTGTSFTEVTGGTGMGFGLMVSYKGSIYGTSVPLTQFNSILYKYTGDKTTRTYSEVGRVPYLADDLGARLFTFNQRIHLSRIDGLWTYDTVLFSAADDLSDNPNASNYRHATKMRGYIYFWMPDGFYRYNGSLIEKLYDNFEIGMPIDMIMSENRLYMLFVNANYTGTDAQPWYKPSWIYDQSVGYNFRVSNQDNIQARVMIFNGKGMYAFARPGNNLTGTGVAPVNTSRLPSYLLFVGGFLYIFCSNYASYWKTSTREPKGRSSKFITSIWDGDFSQITKNMENIEFVLEGKTGTTGNTIWVWYRTQDFDSDSWTYIGDVATPSELKLLIHEKIPAGLSFAQRIQFRFDTSGDTDGLAKIILRSTLMTEYKYEWRFTILAYGDEPVIEPLMLADGTESSQAVSTIRGNIYSTRDKKTPVVYVDVDQVALTTTINNSIATLVVDNTDLLKSSGFIKIEDEIIKYTGKTQTTLTGCKRGMLGTAKVSHTSGAKIFPCYRVILRQIVNERIEMTDKTLQQETLKSRATDITVLIQEV